MEDKSNRKKVLLLLILGLTLVIFGSTLDANAFTGEYQSGYGTDRAYWIGNTNSEDNYIAYAYTGDFYNYSRSEVYTAAGVRPVIEVPTCSINLD